ncbi:MAG: thioredoxin domain-containing protein [Opitutaceae bacterium]|nr:thioredoxin domain-containing protein [Opitutaceae bacterium]|tara:strand:- start:11085 stop:13091 length:2007 start_codon:yes stop_codon:yes gene_type:complete
MPNHLINEKSLYLRQHANNPVDWYPWGEEALAKAKEEDKPLLISIGYSSCHWCHVMEHESFEDEYIAGLMNEHFVCIKVDREERPDIDQIYMEAVQMIAQHGGWPLNVFCLPDGRPFFGGTYFPPEDRQNGMVPWPQALIRVIDFYKKNRDQLEENANTIIKNLLASNAPIGESVGVIDKTTLEQAAVEFARRHDDQFGGFGQAPKFPPSMALNFLLQARESIFESAKKEPGKKQEYDRIDEVIETTLKAMAHGGLFDQIGGGFARYSVDRYWLIPHFEKMLYDNGLLLDIYAKAWTTYRNPLYKVLVEETVTWALREMKSDGDGFYSAFDADSEGEEGKFYVWKPAEIKEVLGEDRGTEFCKVYNITEAGNFEHGFSNPALTEADFSTRESFKDAREQLYEHRAKRVWPGLDKKQLTSWNSLLIRGLAEAGFALDRKDIFDTAKDAADFIWENLRFENNRLHSVYYNEASLNGYLDDYAYHAEALLSILAYVDFYYPGESETYLTRCQAIAKSSIDHFKDEQSAGYFFTSNDHESLIARKKEWWDNATPSGNASLLNVFSCLYCLTADPVYQEELAILREGYSGLIARNPHGVPHALAAMIADQNGIEVIKAKDVDNLDQLPDLLRKLPWRRRFTVISNAENQPPGYQRCIGTLCLQPVFEPTQLYQ